MDKKTNNQDVAQGRRQFLKASSGIALAGVGAALLPGQALAQDAIGRVKNLDKNDKGYWKKVQNEFILDARTCYMNIGSTGSMPRDVLQGFTLNNEIVA